MFGSSNLATATTVENFWRSGVFLVKAEFFAKFSRFSDGWNLCRIYWCATSGSLNECKILLYSPHLCQPQRGFTNLPFASLTLKWKHLKTIILRQGTPRSGCSWNIVDGSIKILPPPKKKNGKVKNPVWWDSCSICMISTGVICISNTRFCRLRWQWKVMKGFPLISHHLGWKSVSSWNPSVLILRSSQVLGSNNLFFPLEVHPKFRIFHLKISPWKRIFFWKPWFSKFMFINLWVCTSKLLGS